MRSDVVVGAPAVRIPAYLDEVYHWAYVSPQAIRRFERQWLVNLILWGNFARLRDLALDALGTDLSGQSLQIACVYGDLSAKLLARHTDAGHLDVLDVLPLQLDNLKEKLGTAGDAVGLHLCDSAAMPFADASYDRALLFFLLHEQPEAVRRRTLAEALRVLKPGGKLMIVDYHRPAPWHPLWLPMRLILATLEPFALDLWAHPVPQWLPADVAFAELRQRTLFGGLYQLIEITR